MDTKIAIAAIVTATLTAGMVGLYIGSNHLFQVPIATEENAIQPPDNYPIQQPNQPNPTLNITPKPTTNPTPEPTKSMLLILIYIGDAMPDFTITLTGTVNRNYG
jgi:hypothetical protein